MALRMDLYILKPGTKKSTAKEEMIETGNDTISPEF